MEDSIKKLIGNYSFLSKVKDLKLKYQILKVKVSRIRMIKADAKLFKWAVLGVYKIGYPENDKQKEVLKKIIEAIEFIETSLEEYLSDAKKYLGEKYEAIWSVL